MKPISGTYIDYAISSGRYAMGELYKFSFINGSFAYFTSLDFDVVWDGNTYLSKSLIIEGLRYKISVGFEVDEQEIKIFALPTDQVGGANFFSAVGSGLLDGAYITRMRASWPALGFPAYLDFAAPPTDVITLFTGRVSTISRLGRTSIELKVKSVLSLLDIDMPRNTYQAGCQWLLYDAGCTMVRATFTDSYVVVSATVGAIVVAAVSPQTGADSLPYYLQGRLLFTSGVNDGVQTLVRFNDATIFYLQYPLVVAPEPGDAFDVSAGCAKTGRGGACELKFNNLNNFRGFPRVPPVVTSV